MENARDWNPDLYLEFRDERTQPSIDLVSRICLEPPPRSIVDIGCGPGNSSQVLRQRWPQSRLVGVDRSPSMIEKAKHDFPDQEWILAEAEEFTSKTKFDLVFSNATIQWIPDHTGLIAHLCDLLSEKGALAVQLPRFGEMLLAKILERVARSRRWRSRLADCPDLITCHDHGFYYDGLVTRFGRVDIWETDYIHVLDSPADILRWIRSTGMKPYLDRLDEEADQSKFETEVLRGIEAAYPLQADGRVLLPFKRLFFIGYK